MAQTNGMKHNLHYWVHCILDLPYFVGGILDPAISQAVMSLPNTVTAEANTLIWTD